MFTGIVEDVGVVRRIEGGPGGGKRLVVETNLDPASIAVGDSICTEGVCLTATSIVGKTFTADAGHETLARTTLGRLTAGSRVNLERSVTPTSRLGGHMVAGHVDAVGTIASVTKNENAYDVRIETPPEVLELCIPRGSIAIDGISLTITGKDAKAFSVMIIPHTWSVTTLGAKAAGSAVNLEADVIARYVAGLLEGYVAEQKAPLTEDFFRKHGF
ncbi:MAG: riboflavin synthase [Deltaproteobacteria bacterium]